MAKSHFDSKPLATSFVKMKTGNPISIHTGVTWNSRLNKWTAQITFRGKSKHLGSFSREDESLAARAYSDELIKMKQELN